MRKLIYVCAPYVSDPERGIDISIEMGRRIATEGNNPISPILNNHPIYQTLDLCEEKSRGHILNFRCDLLATCDAICIVCINDVLSAGQKREYELARALQIPVKCFDI